MKRMLFEFGRTLVHPAVLFILSGLCLSAITFPGGGFLFLPGLVIFLFAVTGTKSPWRACFGGVLVGLFKAAGAIAWLWHTYPLNWVDLNDPITQLVFIGLFWFSCSLFLGSGIGLTALVVHEAWKRFKLQSLVVFPLIWLLGEVLGSFMLSVGVLGAGSYLNAYVVYGYVGLALGRLDLFYSSAALGGIYGLSFSAGVLGVLTFIVLKGRFQYLSALITFILLSAVSSWWFISNHSVSPTTNKVVSIETTFTTRSFNTPEGRADKEREVKDAVSAALLLKPDIILLPEDSRFTTGFSSPAAALLYLHERAPDTQTLVVDSARIETSDWSSALRSFYHDLGVDEVFAVDKQLLVPQGEYPTYLFEKILSWTGNGQSLDFIKRNLNYSPGPMAVTDFPRSLPGTLFCYESASGMGVKNLNHPSGNLVLHPVSHARLHSPNAMWYQLDTMLRIQAIWNQVSIVSAGNLSPSRLYLPSGAIEEGRVLRETSKWKLIEFTVPAD